jgi:DNA-binding FadR family transcriptional regulator
VVERAGPVGKLPDPEAEAHLHLIAPSRISLSDRVAAILRRYVLVEELTAGSRMPPERQLAGTLNISRTVLREAISRLIGEGILTRSSPRILIVAEFDRAAVSASISPIDREAAEFRDLMELRIIMEIGAIDAIVSRMTPRHLAEIERWLVEGERRLAAGEPLHSADARFHAALLRTLGNRAVDAFLPMLQDQMRTHVFFSPHQLRQPSGPEDTRVQREHRDIYEAVRRGDAESARRVMIAHLSHYLVK